MASEAAGDLAGWIGRSRVSEDIVTPRLMAEFRATFAPNLASVPAGEAPPGLHWCLAPETPLATELGPDGHAAKGAFLPPVDLPRRMWAGGTIETFEALRVDDRVTRRETVTDIAFKSGRSGRLCFVTIVHEIATPRGPALRERHDIVYREAAGDSIGGGAAATAVQAEPVADCATILEVEATPTLLFRYSAMTFNGHRFHYDRPYATAVEGYDDLVVHGPLQATVLFNLATTMLGHVPRRFRYRGERPMVANQTFRVVGQGAAGAGFTGVTLDAGGRACLRAWGES